MSSNINLALLKDNGSNNEKRKGSLTFRVSKTNQFPSLKGAKFDIGGKPHAMLDGLSLPGKSANRKLIGYHQNPEAINQSLDCIKIKSHVVA
jgi:hypothetical protein